MAKRSATEEVAPQAKLCKLDPPDGYEATLKPLCEMKEKTLAHAMILTFEDDTEAVRCNALAVLCKLDPTSFVRHVPALIECLNDESRDVRCGALKVLEKLDPTTLAKYALDFVEFLYDCNYDCNHVREVAIKALCLMHPATLAGHMINLCRDDSEQIREVALTTLRKLEPAALSQAAPELFRMLQQDLYDDPYDAQLAAVGLLDEATLKQHVPTLIDLVRGVPNYDVRQCVVEALERLDQATLAKFAHEFAELIVEGAAFEVMDFASRVLEKMEPAALAQHADALFKMLGDDEEFVSDFAAKALCKLDKVDVWDWEGMLQHDLSHVRKNASMVMKMHNFA